MSDTEYSPEEIAGSLPEGVRAAAQRVSVGWTLPAAAAAETGALELAYASAAGYVSEMDALRAEAANLFANIKSEILEKIPGGILAALLRATNPAAMNEAMTQLHAQIRMAEQTVDKEHMHYFQEVAAHNAEYRAMVDEYVATGDAILKSTDATKSATDAVAEKYGITTNVDETLAQTKRELEETEDPFKKAELQKLLLQQLAQQNEERLRQARAMGIPDADLAVLANAQDVFDQKMQELIQAQKEFLDAQDKYFANLVARGEMTEEQAANERARWEREVAENNQELRNVRDVNGVKTRKEGIEKEILHIADTTSKEGQTVVAEAIVREEASSQPNTPKSIKLETEEASAVYLSALSAPAKVNNTQQIETTQRVKL